MTEEQYSSTQCQILTFARLVNGLDLQGFLDAINQAEALGPILDPTLYRDACGNLRDIERLAMGLRVFQREVQGVIAAKEGVA